MNKSQSNPKQKNPVGGNRSVDIIQNILTHITNLLPTNIENFLSQKRNLVEERNKKRKETEKKNENK